MKNLLVTGASGFLGWNVVQQAKEKFHVSAQYNKHNPAFEQINQWQADLSNEAEVAQLLDVAKPAVIIHCAAASHPNFCQQYPELSYQANILANKWLSKHCAERGIKLVFTSTDLVFDGERGNYAEDDIKNPIMLYGEHKAKAEDIIMANLPKSAICRMPLMFGQVGKTGASFIQGFIQKLKANDVLSLFYDEYRSTMHATDAANGLLWAAEYVTGIIHLGGKEHLSRYDFGLLMCEIFGFSKEQILSVSNKSIEMAAPRAANATMNCSMAYALGFNPKLVKERLQEMAKEAH